MTEPPPDFDIRKDFSGPWDPKAAHEYATALFRRFEPSPEAISLGWPDEEEEDDEDEDVTVWSHGLIGAAIHYLHVTPATMTRANFEALLFEVIPREILIGPWEAAKLVVELRAFWQFLQREFALENAAECLDALDDNAVKTLERELGDPFKFSENKKFRLAGTLRGFDVNTAEGYQKWAKAAESIPADELLQIPIFDDSEVLLEPSGVVVTQRERHRDKRKRKNKQARASRRKNR